MHPRPRVLVLSTAYLPLIGGSELAIHHIAQHLKGYEIDVVTGRFGDSKTSEHIDGVRVFRAGGRWTQWTAFVPKVFLPIAIAITARRLMRTHRYVAMHAYQASQAAGAGCILKMLNPSMPFILTLQEGKELSAQSWIIRALRRVAIRRADCVTVISTFLASFARENGARKVEMIPNGVDVAALQEPPRADVPHTIVTLSRLVEKNNVASLIRAFHHVRMRISDARLVIVGDGPLRKELGELAVNLGVAGAIDFMGTIPHAEIRAVLHGAGVFARPSLSEGLGSAFLEAMAARLPVVASAVGGIPDIIRHGSTGLLCDPHDARDIAEHIMRLFEDRDLYVRIREEAFAMVESSYDWSIIAQKMAGVYDTYRVPVS